MFAFISRKGMTEESRGQEGECSRKENAAGMSSINEREGTEKRP